MLYTVQLNIYKESETIFSMEQLSAKRPPTWSLRTFCVITGASRGFGHRIAVRFAERLPAKSCLLLIARSLDGLQSTRSAIECIRSDVTVNLWSIDLTDLDQAATEAALTRALQASGLSADDFEQVMLVHNAATLGNLSVPACQLMDSDELNKYWQLNLTSVVVLNSVVLKRFGDCRRIQQKVLVNVSSRSARMAFKSFGMYCSGKAARDLMFRTIAMEEPDIRVLNYIPGVLQDSAMQDIVMAQSFDPAVRLPKPKVYEGRHVTCDQSAEKLIEILNHNNFDSPAQIDYFGTA